MSRRRFGTDGIRGVANQGPLQISEVRRLGGAIGRLLQGRPELFAGSNADAPVVIGRDTRESGSPLTMAIVEGLQCEGIPTVDLGVAPTPAVGYLAQNAALGVVISASHNPWQDNGIKLLGADRRKISDAAEIEIENLLDSDYDPSGSESSSPDTGSLDSYVEWLTGDVANGLNLSGKRIVLDAANGAAVTVAETVFSRLGADVTMINNSPDGRNINLECGALYPEAVNTLLDRHDLGFTFDGDADRVMVADGAVRDGDAILALCGKWLQSTNNLSKSTVVATVMSNLGLERFLDREGIQLVRTQVGDKYVSREMENLGVVLGGEQSGHIIFNRYAPSGDGILTAIMVCRALADANWDMTSALDGFTVYPQTLVNVRVATRPPDPMDHDEVRAAVERWDADPDLRINVRSSGTEPLVRVMVEGLDEETVYGAAEEIRGIVELAFGTA